MIPLVCTADKKDFEMNDHEVNAAFFKVALAWVGVFIGSITLSDLVLFATLVYTIIQIALSVRKWIRDDDR